MPAPPYGQFGTSGYPQRTIPSPIVQQYPGAKNFQGALGMFGNLAYGPYSQGLSDVESAQQADPMAQQYQQIMEQGGGAYAQPGLGTGAVGSLFSGQMANEAQRQKTQHESTMNALSGIGDIGKALADSIYSQESAANSLQMAENQALSNKISGALDLTATAIDLAMMPMAPSGAAAAASGSQAASTAASGAKGGGAGGGTAPTASSFDNTAAGETWNWMRNTAYPSIRGMFGGGAGVQPIYPSTPGYGSGMMDPSAVDQYASGVYQ